MIDFIVVNKMPFKEIIISEIEKCMNDYNKIYNKDYKIKKFDDYNKSFTNEINKKCLNQKIYILNISFDKIKNKHLLLRKIKSNNKNTHIIITSKDNIDFLTELYKYSSKIFSETNTIKLRESIYEFIKNINTYNDVLLKLNIKENNVLHIINIDDIISISKNNINKLLTIKTNHLTLTTQLDYLYLKQKLPKNFKDIENQKIINTDYFDNKILEKNLIVVSKHTRRTYKESYKKNIVIKYENKIITKSDLKQLGIPLSTFKNWLKKYGSNSNLNIKIEISNK